MNDWFLIVTRAWICLALVVSIARSSGSLTALYTLLCFLAFVAVMLVVIRPILAWLSRYSFLMRRPITEAE